MSTSEHYQYVQSNNRLQQNNRLDSQHNYLQRAFRYDSNTDPENLRTL